MVAVVEALDDGCIAPFTALDRAFLKLCEAGLLFVMSSRVEWEHPGTE